MARSFDASLKDLIEQFPGDWLSIVGLPSSAAIDVIDADIATVTAAADKVVLVQESPPWLLHLELQSGSKPDLPGQLHWYNTLLGHRHRRLVHTVVVLLRPSADGRELTGTYEEQFPGQSPYLVFRYQVLRVWQEPAERFLAGGLGTLPLAPISAAAETELPAVVREIDGRLKREASPELAAVLGAATYILTGLRLPAVKIRDLYQGVAFMSILEDSSSYQLILEKGMAKGREAGRAEGRETGRQEEVIAILLRLGAKKFGPPDGATEAALLEITDLARLERMSERLLDVANWADLLATS